MNVWLQKRRNVLEAGRGGADRPVPRIGPQKHQAGIKDAYLLPNKHYYSVLSLSRHQVRKLWIYIQSRPTLALKQAISETTALSLRTTILISRQDVDQVSQPQT